MPDALIFDDDPGIGELVGELLRGRGLTSAHFPSGAGVMQIVKDVRPRLVVLDIMMPGVDGLTACRSIRESPATRHTKIVILTAKQFEQDREAAKRYGADLFFNKPFDTAALAADIGKLLGVSAAPAPPASQAPAAPLVMTLNAGGAVLDAGKHWVFFDAGKGVARWLGCRSSRPESVWVLLTRFDPEAIEELPSFGSLLSAGVRVSLAGPDDAESLLQRLGPRLSGLPGARTSSTALLYPQREGEMQLAPGMLATTRYTQHGGSCLAWRIDVQGRRIVWCPANEVQAVTADWNRHEREKFRGLFTGADLLVHGFGSSAGQAGADPRYRGAWEPVVALARDARVKSLALTPLPGARPDGIMESLSRSGAAGAMQARIALPGAGWIL